MKRLVIVVLASAVTAACGGAPPPARSAGEPFKVTSSQAGPDGRLVLEVRVAQPATEAAIKAAAESVIAEHRAAHDRITVLSFVEGGPSSAPSMETTFERGLISHLPGSVPASQKIPSH